MGTFVSRRRVWVGLGAVVLAAAVAFVFVWFQPHKLWIDDEVDEAAPTVAPRTSDPGSSAVPEPPAELAQGMFASLDHHTAGTAAVLDVGAGARVLRIEGLDTSNGPDLYVYLTTNAAEGPEGAFDDEFVDLGRLKGNQGDQNYDVPADVDLERFSTVVIWCDRFDSAFGAADLQPAGAVMASAAG